MDFNDHLYFFREILREVKVMFPGCHPVIGGGALRDAFHNRPIKDVDVFLRATDHPLGLKHPFIQTLISQDASSSGGGMRHDLHGCWDVMFRIQGFQVQLIVTDFENATDLAGTFDLGLSRITYDGESVFYHDDFIRDSHAKQFRIVRADDDGQTTRSERRIERLLGKYPDFKRAA